MQGTFRESSLGLESAFVATPGCHPLQSDNLDSCSRYPRLVRPCSCAQSSSSTGVSHDVFIYSSPLQNNMSSSRRESDTGGGHPSVDQKKSHCGTWSPAFSWHSAAIVISSKTLPAIKLFCAILASWRFFRSWLFLSLGPQQSKMSLLEPKGDEAIRLKDPTSVAAQNVQQPSSKRHQLGWVNINHPTKP